MKGMQMGDLSSMIAGLAAAAEEFEGAAPGVKEDAAAAIFVKFSRLCWYHSRKCQLQKIRGAVMPEPSTFRLLKGTSRTLPFRVPYLNGGSAGER